MGQSYKTMAYYEHLWWCPACDVEEKRLVQYFPEYPLVAPHKNDSVREGKTVEPRVLHPRGEVG